MSWPVSYVENQEALRTPAARKERRTALLLGAVVVFTLTWVEPLYRAFNGPMITVRTLWCAAMAIVGLALPRASNRLYGWLLPLVGAGSCWLFATTVWL